VKMTGSAVTYRFNVTNYFSRLGGGYFSVTVVSVDDAWCEENETDWPQFYALEEDGGLYPLGRLDSTGTIEAGDWARNWITQSGGSYYHTIVVSAPHCVAADDADIEISKVTFNMYLHPKSVSEKSVEI